MPLAILVKAIGIECITKLANGAAIIIIAARGPLALVFVGLMSTPINHTPGVESGIDSMQISIKTKPCISGHSIHV